MHIIIISRSKINVFLNKYNNNIIIMYYWAAYHVQYIGIIIILYYS